MKDTKNDLEEPILSIKIGKILKSIVLKNMILKNSKIQKKNIIFYFSRLNGAQVVKLLKKI